MITNRSGQPGRFFTVFFNPPLIMSKKSLQKAVRGESSVEQQARKAQQILTVAIRAIRATRAIIIRAIGAIESTRASWQEPFYNF